MLRSIATILLCLFVVFAVTNNAKAGQLITGTISQTATNAGAAWFVLNATDGTYTGSKGFVFPSQNMQTLLATALTAQTSGKSVYVYVDSLENGSCLALSILN